MPGAGVETRAKLALARLPALDSWIRRARSLGAFALRRPHDPDFGAFALFADRRGLFLDVGANRGQSALSFRIYNRSAPILSIEPLVAHEPDLRFVKRFLSRFDYRICAAGEHPGRARLHVPVLRGMALTVEASLDRDTAAHNWFGSQLGAAVADEVRIESFEVPVCRLDDLGLSPDFVKIDTEGSEGEVVAGLSETLARCRPVLMVERRASSFAAVCDRVRGLGYRPHAWIATQRRLRPLGEHRPRNVFFLSGPGST